MFFCWFRDFFALGDMHVNCRSSCEDVALLKVSTSVDVHLSCMLPLLLPICIAPSAPLCESFLAYFILVSTSIPILAPSYARGRWNRSTIFLNHAVFFTTFVEGSLHRSSRRRTYSLLRHASPSSIVHIVTGSRLVSMNVDEPRCLG